MAERVPHRQSLLRIPLMRQLYEDPQCKVVKRRVDARWRYERITPGPVSGFNPLTSSVYCAATSRFAEWFKDPFQSSRKFNESDRLVSEALMILHDYLHIWSYLAINEVAPQIGFGTKPITAGNLEDFAFCHLVTEACATVGLDYWYLSCTDLNQVTDLGTNRRLVTVSYHERDLEEYRRYNPDLEVQSKEFFKQLAEFYCSSVFEGFSVHDLKDSPKIMEWLKHELEYGEKQREYIRRWLAYLSHQRITFDDADLARPARIDKKWKKDLIQDLGELLWEKVKGNTLHTFKFRFNPGAIWQSSRKRRPDFRFINLNRQDGDPSAEDFDYYLTQSLARLDFEAFDWELAKTIPFLREKKDPGLLRAILRGQKEISIRVSKDEPRDLFILA